MERAKAFPFQPSKSNPQVIELKTSASFDLNEPTKDAVEAFLKGGGKIQKLPDEPTKKTPDVNIPFEHISDELYEGEVVASSLERIYGNHH